MSQIIIKKKKNIVAHAHHGGAWKVAYADFVTAMMAFFLLMWLLNATTEEQRKGIADYFNPNIPVAAISGGGTNALSGDSIFAKDVLSQDGTGAENRHKPSDIQSQNRHDLRDRVEALNTKIAQDHPELSEHLHIVMTPEGLTLELTDRDSRPLFELGSAAPSPILRELIALMGDAFGEIDNGIKIVGHTDARQYISNAPYSNWELSIDRANTARRLLLGEAVNKYQIKEVSGKADLEPFNKEDPLAPENRRISITILN